MVTIDADDRWTFEADPCFRTVVRVPANRLAFQLDGLLAIGTGDDHLAETKGFEPLEPFRVRQFSKLVT